MDPSRIEVKQNGKTVLLYSVAESMIICKRDKRNVYHNVKRSDKFNLELEQLLFSPSTSNLAYTSWIQHFTF